MTGVFIVRCARCLKLAIVEQFPQVCECGRRVWEVNNPEPKPYRLSRSDKLLLGALKIGSEE